MRDAWSYGFFALTVSDAMAALSQEEHVASMTNLKYFGGVITAEELEQEFQA